MLLLGIDLGSSSVKASVIDGNSGECLATAFYPSDEMKIIALKPGWAEQDPEIWWTNLKDAITDCTGKLGMRKDDIGAIGISYQMHGLVTVDNNKKVLRPSIIWCDSRAVEYGEKALNSLGKEYCLKNLLNSPGNFTAAKLAWVKENAPDLFARIHKVMLTGDHIALRLTGEINTSFTGLSEGIFWNYCKNQVSEELMTSFGFDTRLGVLLCINGTGILNSWLRRNSGGNLSYNEMNEMAEKVAPGSDGLCILPFGNGAERMLGNKDPGARITGLNFNTHTNAHMFRAAQEGIAFSFRYG